jgi:hypothetical protein
MANIAQPDFKKRLLAIHDLAHPRHWHAQVASKPVDA